MQHRNFAKNRKHMKNTLILLVAVFTLVGCAPEQGDVSTEIVKNPKSASGEQTPEKLPGMEFEEELFAFGKITQGEKVEHTYVFTNTGDADLIITSAKGSCGCTVPEWPKKPIKPGEKGEINVVFDSEGKKGRQHKKVTIVANTQPSTNVIALSGEVVAPETN